MSWLDATPCPAYEGYSPTLQPFGEGDEPSAHDLPFGFAQPARHFPAAEAWWLNDGCVD